jgi:PKD repeat protein
MPLNALSRVTCLCTLAACISVLLSACQPRSAPLPAMGHRRPAVETPTSVTHAVSIPPDLDSAAAVLSWDSGAGNLTWYYSHPGDYNQDGLVTVNDITPLGVNFNAEGPFDIASALSVVDGNSDGLITVNDITPIGQNYNKSIERYQAFHSESMSDYPTSNTAPNGAGATLLGTVQLRNNPLLANKRRLFTLHLSSPPPAGYGWVRPLCSEFSPGTPSTLVSFGNAGGNVPPTVLLSANPMVGGVPCLVEFTASGDDSDGEIVQYSWDFEGDGVVDCAGLETIVTHTYDTGGQFNATVTGLDDAGGEDSASVMITISGSGGQPPVAHLQIIPENAPPGTTVVLHGAGSSDPEGTTLHYSFDPEGDGSFRPPDTDMSLNWTYRELGSFQPALRVFDEDGQFDTTQGNLEISLGTLEKHVIDQQVGEVPAGLNVGLMIAGGKPAIAYYDPSAEMGLTLRWCNAKDAAGSDWWDHRALGTCSGNFNLGLAKGNPAIAYCKNSDIYFMRADDGDGSGSWSFDERIIEAAALSHTSPLYLPSLALINDRPTVLCINSYALFGGDLVYIEATNEAATGWPHLARVIANNLNYIAFISALAEIDGRPATAFVGGFVGDEHIMYMRSYDADGISWTLTPMELTPTGQPTLSSNSLRVINGRPAIVFYDGNEHQVNYIWAEDSEGSQWGTPQVVGAADNTEGDLDIAVINDLPCVAFGDINQGLYLAVALDRSGQAWNEPVLVDAGEYLGKSVRLVEIDNRAALAYYNRGRNNIEFAVYRP